MDEMARFFKVFCDASRMGINWEKSSVYWFNKNMHKHEWLAGYGWRWAEVGDLSILLSTLFGLNVSTLDVDKLLHDKILKKFDYWSIVKLSLEERIARCNQILLSNFWFSLLCVCVGGGDLTKSLGKSKMPFETIFVLGKNNLHI